MPPQHFGCSVIRNTFLCGMCFNHLSVFVGGGGGGGGDFFFSGKQLLFVDEKIHF